MLKAICSGVLAFNSNPVGEKKHSSSFSVKSFADFATPQFLHLRCSVHPEHFRCTDKRGCCMFSSKSETAFHKLHTLHSKGVPAFFKATMHGLQCWRLSLRFHCVRKYSSLNLLKPHRIHREWGVNSSSMALQSIPPNKIPTTNRSKVSLQDCPQFDKPKNRAYHKSKPAALVVKHKYSRKQQHF